MDQDLRIVISVDKQTDNLKATNTELNNLDGSTKKATNSSKQLKESTNALSSAYSTLKGIIASAIGIGMAKEYMKVSDTMSLLEARIKLVSKAGDNYALTQKELVRIANENRISYESVGELYAKLSPAMQTLHADTSTVIDITDAYSKSLLIGGASTAEAAGSTRQFAQAMSSGVLRGDEFNSMMENNPRAMRVLTESLGKTQGELRKMAENGELASGIVAGALLRGITQLADEAKKMPNTMSGELQRIQNEASLTVEAFNKLTGANAYIADSMSIITKGIVNFRDELPKVNKNIDEFTEKHKYAYATLKALAELMESFGAQTVDSVENSSGVMGKLFESSGRGFIGWIDNIGKTLESYGLLNIEIAKTNSTISIIPSRPFEENIKQVSDLTTAMDTLNKKMFNYNSLLFPKKMSLAPFLDIQKQREIAATALEKEGKDTVATTKRVKESTAAINTQMSALEKQYSIQKEIQNLDVESALIAEKVTKPEAEYLKEINDIKSQIAKNQQTINLLNAIPYDKKNDQNWETDQIKNLEKANELKKDNELLTIKQTAAEQKKASTIKTANDELLTSINAINISDTDKKYQDLVKSVQDLIGKGADLALVGEYATKVADQISREDAYSHLQTELDIRTQIAEVSLYGTEKETALEQIRHDGVMANLSRELDTKKLNASEYAKLLGIENQRNKQNSDSFYKFMMDGFDNVNKAMDENFFNGLTGKFKKWGDWFDDFISTLGTSAAQGLSRTLAGGITNNLQSNFVNAYKTYGGLSASSSLVGATLSASDISAIMTSGGTFDSGTNTVKTTAGTAIKLAGDGSGTVTNSGSDLTNGLNIFSGIKTAYGVLTNGISGSIMSGFNGISDVLASGGFWEASAGVSNFGYGVANPFSYGAGSGAFTSTTVGAGLSSGLIGGLTGYGIGSLGDKIFGADTYAGTAGAIGGALGGVGASLGLWGGPIGIIAGSLIGSVLGGLFGKTKVTGKGIDIYGTASAENADGRYYTGYQKKSWFSSKKWETYQGFSSEEIDAIQTTIGAYDYLLSKLGEYNDLVVAGGRFSSLQSFLDTNVVKAFLVEINPNELDAIYQSWVDYAAKIDSTITEAISSAVSSYVTYGRGFTEWNLGSGTVEQLAFTAGYLKTDFEALAESLGASSVNASNFLSMYDTAIKNNFTQETIEKWASLGDALMKSTDAAKEYQDALDSLNTSTTLSLPTDMLLQNLTVSSNTVDFEELIKAQATGNSKTDKMVTYLYEILKLQRDLIRVTKFGTNQGIPA